MERDPNEVRAEGEKIAKDAAQLAASGGTDFSKIKEHLEAYNKLNGGHADYGHGYGTCPRCGYCPHCGRGGWYQPSYPWVTYQTGPYAYSQGTASHTGIGTLQ